MKGNKIIGYPGPFHTGKPCPFICTDNSRSGEDFQDQGHPTNRSWGGSAKPAPVPDDCGRG